MNSHRAVKCACLLLACTVLFAGTTFGQTVAGLGAITGVVRDATGAAVPGAKVMVANPAKGIRRTLESNEAGVFNAPSLPPSGGYVITASKAGFANWELKDFELLVGQTQNFNITLSVAATATTIEVTATAPLISETNVGVSQVVEHLQIDNLPINGRRADTFVLLTPAVTSDGAFGLVSFRGIAGGNAFLTDGNDTTQSFYNENAGRTRISTQISQDAVQEFQVLSNGFSAEFGRALGGVINTVTKSGTNSLHGTAYWFFRNRTLNAADRYASGVNPPEWRHQAGGTLGGPIKKDKLFYFANFEVVKRNFPALNRIINTAFTDTGGNRIVAPCTATAAQCATAMAFITRQMNVTVPRTVGSAMGFAKIDWRPTERNAFSLSGNVMHWRSPHGIQTQAVLSNGNAVGNNGNSTVETRYGKASWTSLITNSSVNEVRFGWFKDRLSDPAASDLFPPETGPLYMSLGGATIGAATQYPRTMPSEQRFQIVDNYSWTHGAHSARFGVDFQTTEDWLDSLYNRSGSYSYSSLNAFATDFSGNAAGVKSYSSFTQAFGNPVQDLQTSDINFYAQDVWKVSRKLTLNYGLRYEKSFLPQPTITNPDWPQTGRVPSPSKNFAPRASLAYALGSKTVIRAGYGIFWARFQGFGLSTLFTGNGKYQTTVSILPTAAGAPVLPNVFSSATGLPSGSVNLYFAAPGFHNPYTQQANLTIERQLSSDMALTVSCIWSRGIGLWVQRDLNLGTPGAVRTYTILDSGGNQVGAYTTPIYTLQNRVDPRYSKILQVENGGQSWYNGLAIQLRKRMSHGLSASLSYTWSHAIDDGNQQGASWNLGWNYFNATFNGDYTFDKGSSTLDQRHRAVINWVWEPKVSIQAKAASVLANGWQLSAVTTLASSQPTSATINVSGTQFSGVSFANTNTLNGSGGWTRVPFWPVNSLDIDRTYRVDARLTRSITLRKERVRANLSFEAFNVFNTITNTGVNTQAFASTAGTLRPTVGLGRGNQSQGFPDGTNARRMQLGLRFIF
jgi:hypothetical protein